jgi:hypothetical protein
MDTVVPLYYVVSEYINNNSAVRNLILLSTTLKFFSYPTSQHPPTEDHHFVMSFKMCDVLITNFINPSNPIFSAHYILQYLHFDVRPNIVRNFRGTAYCEYVLSLKMAFIAKTDC